MAWGGGVSDLGEDHFVPVDPSATDQIEVIRGPATLRYGSQSIGAVVSSTDDRIPERTACGPFSPLSPLPGIYKAPLLSRPAGLHDGRGATPYQASTTAVRAACCSIPAPATSPSTPTPLVVGPTITACVLSLSVRSRCGGSWFANADASFNGRQLDIDSRSNEQWVGGCIFPRRLRGHRHTRYENLYAIPARRRGHGTHIDAHQDKLAGKGEYRRSASGIDAVRYWWGYTDYKHNEIGFADPADPATDGIRQTFTNKDLEGRAEVQLCHSICGSPN